MLPKLKFYFTNWIDGMKISRRHFVDSENALLDRQRDINAMFLNTYNYGLLLPEPGEKNALDCNVLVSQSHKFKISVTLCRAVTPGGCRVEIIPGVHPELLNDNDIFGGYDDRNMQGAYYAVISVDPFNRQPFGEPDVNEYPPRHPYSMNTYKLNLVPEDALNTSQLGTFHFPVARFKMKNEELVRDPNYIPPCSVMGAHGGTKQIYNTISEQFNIIQEAGIEIIKKVVGGGQNTALALNVKKLCEGNISFISSESFLFRNMYRNMSPVMLANAIVKFASFINVTVNVMPDKEKEEMLQYFSYWNEISPGKFEEMLTSVVDADYDHDNIYDCFQPLIGFLKVWSDLLEKLKPLKLIGQRNEKFDFGGRTMETPKTKEKGKFNIFD